MKREIVLINIDDTETAKAVLNGELAKRNITRQQLANMLSTDTEVVTKASIDNKMSRGTFSADFFLSCLRAIGCTDIGVNCDDSSSLKQIPMDKDCK